jgi:hypothetical protein
MSANRPVLLLCPVRNAIHDLRRSLPTWSLIADKIIIVDQGSTDGSREFLGAHDKVILVDNADANYSEIKRNALLVEAARQVCGCGIHLTLDADEILSSNVLKSPEWIHFRGMQPGTVGVFKWIQLWKTPEHYIARGAGAPGRYQLAFVDDGRPIEGKKIMHEQRGVGVQNPEQKFVFNDVVCLHYAWMNFQAAVRRNNYYKVYWVMQGAGSYHVNNRNHGWYRSVRESDLANSPADWLEGYTNRGLDVTSIGESSLYWWDIEVLRAFKTAGIKRFYPLDIWREVDWEQLRRNAIAENVTGIDDTPIVAAGPFRCGYHMLTIDGFDLSRVVTKARRFMASKLLP